MNYQQHTQATEIELLEMMSRADRQHLPHKLLAVLEQELHDDVQLLVLETVRPQWLLTIFSPILSLAAPPSLLGKAPGALQDANIPEI